MVTDRGSSRRALERWGLPRRKPLDGSSRSGDARLEPPGVFWLATVSRTRTNSGRSYSRRRGGAPGRRVLVRSSPVARRHADPLVDPLPVESRRLPRDSNDERWSVTLNRRSGLVGEDAHVLEPLPRDLVPHRAENAAGVMVWSVLRRGDVAGGGAGEPGVEVDTCKDGGW